MSHYSTHCPICGATVSCNIQGTMLNHDKCFETVVCGAAHGEWIGRMQTMTCTRPKGHPGEHCMTWCDTEGQHGTWWK